MNKITLIALIFFITVSACDSVKRGLSGQKKRTTQEFLVKSKDPLVVLFFCPDDVEGDIEKLLNTKKSKTKKISSKGTKSLEESIIKEINDQ